MLKSFVLLIASIILLTHASAEELSYNVSGSLYQTWISEHAFHENTNALTINGSVEYGNWAVRAQLSDKDTHWRRAVLEYAITSEGNTLIFQAGRIPRINTLFANVYGDPADWGMSILPLGMYNRRMVNETNFSTLDGGKVIFDHNYDHGNIRFSYDFGRAPIENYDNLQMEFTRKPVIEGMHFDSEKGDYTIGIEASYDNWTTMYSKSKLNWHSELDNPRSRAAKYLYLLAEDVQYYFDRLGLRYATPDWEIISEYGYNKLYVENSLSDESQDMYLLGRVFFDYSTYMFTGYTYGIPKKRGYTARDRFIGIGHNYHNWTGILEYHNGENSWQRHNSEDYTWNAWAASLIYKF